MKRILLAAALLLSFMGVFAQAEEGDYTWQPRFGLSYSDFRGSDAKGYTPRMGFIGGIDFEYQAYEKWSTSGAILFNSQCVNADVADYSNPFIRMNYLQVPILVNYYAAKGLAVKAGLQLSYLLNAKVCGKKDGRTEKVGITDRCNRIDIAIPIGVSYEYRNFVVEARYNAGLLKVFDKFFMGSSLQPVEKIYNSNFSLTIGYKFVMSGSEYDPIKVTTF